MERKSWKMGWKKRYQFPSSLALPYPQKSWIKEEQGIIYKKSLLLIMGVIKLDKINPKSQLKYSRGIDGKC